MDFARLLPGTCCRKRKRQQETEDGEERDSRDVDDFEHGLSSYLNLDQWLPRQDAKLALCTSSSSSPNPLLKLCWTSSASHLTAWTAEAKGARYTITTTLDWTTRTLVGNEFSVNDDVFGGCMSKGFVHFVYPSDRMQERQHRIEQVLRTLRMAPGVRSLVFDYFGKDLVLHMLMVFDSSLAEHTVGATHFRTRDLTLLRVYCGWDREGQVSQMLATSQEFPVLRELWYTCTVTVERATRT